jgi:hypothetical protein
VGSTDTIACLIDTLIGAVRTDELDEGLAQASKAATVKRPKKAA